MHTQMQTQTQLELINSLKWQNARMVALTDN